jgi:hypothetical protein
MKSALSETEIERIREHLKTDRISLAVIRARAAPTELEKLFKPMAKQLDLSLLRNLWSPTSDFGFAEFNSNGKMLVVLYVGGQQTELVSVSETDEVFVADLEETVCSSNIQSSSIRDGL